MPSLSFFTHQPKHLIFLYVSPTAFFFLTVFLALQCAAAGAPCSCCRFRACSLILRKRLVSAPRWMSISLLVQAKLSGNRCGTNASTLRSSERRICIFCAVKRCGHSSGKRSASIVMTHASKHPHNTTHTTRCVLKRPVWLVEVAKPSTTTDTLKTKKSLDRVKSR